MDFQNLFYVILIGLAAGWLASRVMRQSLSLLGYLILGIVGAVLGNFLLGLVQISTYGLIGNLISAFIGAVALLYLIQLIRK